MTSDHPKLLIVDDVADNRLVLSRRFERQDFEVAHAEDGATALEMIDAHDFDLILLDIVMPGIDGIEVLRRIRARHSIAALPVIMVTARTEAEDVAQALEIGANDYITKPVNFAVALARVKAQIARKQAEKALRQANEELERHVLDLAAANRQLEVEIVSRKETEARVQHLAVHDLLTGLENRNRFREQMIRSLARIGEGPGSLALLVLNLDRFKATNETLGHGAGDTLLQIVAERLQGCIGDGDKIARLGGDEFGVIQTGIAKPEEATDLAQKIIEAVAVPCHLSGERAAVSCSIGIAIAPNDGTDPDLLLRSADMALNRAKVDGPGSYRFFEPEMNARAQARRVLETDLRKALAAREFEVFYQPLFNLASGAISGCEALLRWRHPERGMVSPAEFIPLAEEIGLIVPLGEWVLRQACADAVDWPGHTKLAVNLSAAQFRCGNLLDTVASALSASGLAASRLELEITETLILSEDERTIGLLHALRQMGARISMDDFGTGYSSLSYLRSFPFDKIKIDQSFIRDLSLGDGSLAIVRAITSLAESLGMITTAEGVETEEQFSLLKAQGCTEIQGYLIGRPVSASDISSVLSASVSAAQSNCFGVRGLQAGAASVLPLR